MTQPNQRPILLLDMVADVVCPWCYVGFRALDWAKMALSFQYELQVRYRPYRLDPDVPAEGRDRKTTIAGKFPDPNHRESIRLALDEAMKDVGLDFSAETPERIPDSSNAHRLVRWAHEVDAQHQVLSGLYEAYWHHGEDISEVDVLLTVAEQAELDVTEIKARLQTQEDLEAVRQEAAEFRGGGVDGVPTFIVNEKTGFAGALPKAKMLEALKTLAME